MVFVFRIFKLANNDFVRCQTMMSLYKLIVSSQSQPKTKLFLADTDMLRWHTSPITVFL